MAQRENAPGDGARQDAAVGSPDSISDDAARLAQMSLDADFLRTIIEESNRCFFLIDPESQGLVYISPAFERLWGIAREEFYRDGNRWYETIHPADVDGCRRAVEIRLQALDVRHPPFEYRIRRTDGEERWIRGNLFECRHTDGDAKLLCGLAEDITAAKRYDAERTAAHAALEDTVAERTSELTALNKALRGEIARRAETERELREKQAFLERLLRYQEWDRRLMALEIHDGAIQNVVAAQMHLDGAAADALTESQRGKLAEARQLLQDAINESRRVIEGMRPQTLDDLGLLAALEETAAANEHRGLAVQLQYEIKLEQRSPMVETTIFRLVQEALSNVRRHAETDRARVELRSDGSFLLLQISDAGIGFDPAQRDGFGLRGLRERAASVGGEVQIQSAPGRGTVITARLPLLDPVDSATLERDLAAAALHNGRLRHQAILDQTSAVVFVKDASGRYELINRRYESLFHVRREAFIGKSDLELFPPEIADKLRANDRRVLTEDRSITFEESVPSNGEMRDYITVKFPIPGEPGMGPSLCGIATDITEQKRQLRALLDMQRRFAAFMDHSPMLAWIKDADGRYVFVNQKLLTVHGLEADQVIGKDDFSLFSPEVAAVLREHDCEVMRTGLPQRFKEDCPAGKGPVLTWESIKFRIQCDDGAVLVAGVALDVSKPAAVENLAVH